MIFSKQKRILSAFLSLTMIGTMVASVPFTASAATTKSPYVAFSVFENNTWKSFAKGTAGQASKGYKVSAIKAALKNAPKGASLNVSIYENKKWLSNSKGAVIGSAVKKTKLYAEALKATLKGCSGYTLSYKVFENKKWTAATKNGAIAGKTGKKLAIEAVQFTITKNSKPAPEPTPVVENPTVSTVDSPADVTVSKGTTSADAIAKLPTTVVATLSDGSTKTVGVTWTAPTTYDATVAATYAFAGKLADIDGVDNTSDVEATANVIVSAPSITSVTPASKTELKVVLSTAVDSIAASNFTIAGATVTAATLSTDKTTATLEVSGLSLSTSYTLVASKILVSGAAIDFGSKDFTSLGVTDLWNLTVTPTLASIVSNGSDNTQVTFTLLNKTTGAVDTNADNVVLDLNTTYGTLTSKRITIQNGVATTLLTSEFSNTGVTAKIDAQIIEASGDYQALIGKVSGTTNVSFVPTGSSTTVNTVTLVGAESDQADRATLFFDQDVSLKNFIKQDASGNLLYNVTDPVTGVITVDTAATIPAGTAASQISDDFINDANTIVIDQGGAPFIVKGLKPVAGNTKAMVAILDTTKPVLADNSNVNVKVNALNSLNKPTISSTNFTLTDARNPSVTSVSPNGLNTLTVKFSEAVPNTNSYDFTIDGLYNFTKNDFTVTYGEFNPATLEDNRDVATITLTPIYDEDNGAIPSTTLAGYFTAGTHSLQVSSLADYANASDKSNVGTTQNLNFTIAADTSTPTATATVESPEQFRVTFNKAVTLNTATAATLATAITNGQIAIKVWDATTSTYITSKVTANDFTITQAGTTGNQYVVELTKDWTTLYDTTATNKNYYNDKYEITIAAGLFANPANGLTNAALALDLSYANSPLTFADTTSPVISSITQTAVNSNTFNVTMSEPVKLVIGGFEKDNAGDTLAQTQTAIGTTTATFYGKDVNGNTVTFDATVGVYTDADGADKIIPVSWNAIGTTTPQTIVDAGGSTTWTLAVRSLSDDAGNTAATSTTSFTIPKSVTAASTFTVTNVIGNTNTTNPDTIYVTYSKAVQLSGSFDATSINQYTLNGSTLPVGTIITRDASKTLVTITLPDGTLKAGSNDLVVNQQLKSADSTVLTGTYDWLFTIDSTAPNAPAITTPAGNAVGTVTLTGTAEAGSLITVTGGKAVATAVTSAAVAPADGAYSVVVTLTPSGTNTLSVTATDAAGNKSAATTVDITETTVPPVPPTITTTAGTYKGYVTLIGTATTGSNITVTGGKAIASAIATSGAYSVVVALTANTANTLTVTATDGNGNATPAAAPVIITEDSIAPTAAVAAGSTASDLKLTPSETASIAVTGGTAVPTATAGTNEITFASDVADGATVTFTLTDLTLNVSAVKTATFSATTGWSIA